VNSWIRHGWAVCALLGSLIDPDLRFYTVTYRYVTV
jgi:hypothetical protein